MSLHTLPTYEAEARVFQRLQWRLFRTWLAQGLTTSRLRYALVAVLSAMLWLGLFRLSHEGFHFMRLTLPLRIHEQVVQGIFNFFFLALFLMLVFSTAVILYGGLFRGGQIAYLLTLPVREERVFLYQFQYAVFFSSWGFVLLASPMLVAYGIVARASWYYYVMLLPMLVAFVYIPAGIGAIALLSIMYFFPRKRLHLLLLAGLATAVVGVLVLLVAVQPAGKRNAHLALVRGDAPPLATDPGKAAAQLVAEHGPAGNGRARLVGRRSLPGLALRQRHVHPRAGRRVCGADLSPSLLGGRRRRPAARAVQMGLFDRA